MNDVNMEKNAVKAAAGRAAVDALVKSGMKLGLGTGSTAIPAVRRVGELLAEGRLTGIRAVATSFQTVLECECQGIPLMTLASPEINGGLDLTIDGADEVDAGLRLVKGGGGALLLEKITAYVSADYAIVVDDSKLVDHLGLAARIPVEVVPDARLPVTRALEALGADVVLREAVRKAGPVITDRGNLLLDILFPAPIDPEAIEAAINRIPGVVENGIFAAPPYPGSPRRWRRPRVFVAHRDGSVETVSEK